MEASRHGNLEPLLYLTRLMDCGQKNYLRDIQAAGDVERGTVTVADGTPTFVAATGD